MKTVQTSRFAPARSVPSVVLLGVMMTLVAFGSTPVSASTGNKAKPLSLANVTVNTGPNTPQEPFFDALQAGLFKKFGLNVTWLETTGGGMQDVETISSGASDFTVTTASNSLIAAQQGSPLRGLFTTSVGSPQQITITKSFAAAHNIPSSSGTIKDIETQFRALKGSHITIAVSGVTGTNVVFMFALTHKYGLTMGSSCGTCDINLETVGSVPNSVAAYDAGKADAIANVPPYTIQPDSVVIPDGKLQPVNSALATFGDTTISMVQQHPDTVQAFVDAVTDAMTSWRRTHRALADSIMESALENNGNSATQAIAATKAQSVYFKNPYPTKAQYQSTLAIYNLSSATPYTIAYSTFFVLRFLANAERLFHVAPPT